jgi:drug/metabolite transporter (DMT)-like permease
MSAAASVMIVASGAAHAVVNAILKSGRDKMSSRALIDGAAAILILPAVFLTALPHGAWGWLAGSWAVHLVYLVCLVKAFETADMSVAYPIARGIAPALAAIGAAGVFREPLSWPVALGIAMVCAGVLTVGLGRHAGRKAVAWAAATGVCIAVYTVIDAQGVRAAPDAPSYIVWLYLAHGFGIGLIFALWRGPVFLLEARGQWRPGLLAGLLSIVTYGLALWAFRLGDTPRLAALRETSILFATAIAVFVLKEPVTRRRLAGVGAIAAGAATLLANG